MLVSSALLNSVRIDRSIGLHLKGHEIKLKQTLQCASVSIVIKQQMCHSRNLSRRFFMSLILSDTFCID